MKALAEALAVKPPRNINAFEAFEDDGDDEHFQSACIEEIDRYRRIDEWIPSYHNILSTTALDCKRILAKAGVLKPSPAEFLEYTPEETSDHLRLNAFENLMGLGFANHDAILRWFLFVLGNDPSPFVRDNMLRILGKTLGSIAIGEHLEAAKAQAAQHDGLVIEQEASTEARQLDIARKQTVEGALNALKDEMSSNLVLKTEIWNAITSPALTIRQLGELLDICDILYTPETSMTVRLRYPRYWTCSKIGKGKLLFAPSSRVRTTLIPKQRPMLTIAPPAPPPNIKRENSIPGPPMAPPLSAIPPLKLKLGGPKKPPLQGLTTIPTSVEPMPPTPGGESQEGPPKLKIKFKGLKATAAGNPAP